MRCRRHNGSQAAKLRARTAQPAVVPDSKNPPSTNLEMHIDGRSEGPIDCSGTVTVGPRANVTGDIRAKSILVEGEVRGNLHAQDLVRINAGARVQGNICAQRIAIAKDGTLRGRITMRRRKEAPEILDDRAAEKLLSGS
jgi:cytoskeletal protein CcmA (bactofilin family)